MNKYLADLVTAALALSTGLSQTVLAAPVHSRDDRGHAIKLDQSARRAIKLAPHATELVYAAGAGEFLIATVDASDYPAQALNLPRHWRWSEH